MLSTRQHLELQGPHVATRTECPEVEVVHLLNALYLKDLNTQIVGGVILGLPPPTPNVIYLPLLVKIMA